MKELTNRQIDDLIQKTFMNIEVQFMLHDRIIEGKTFEQLIEKYYLDTGLSDKYIIERKILPALNIYEKMRKLVYGE